MSTAIDFHSQISSIMEMLANAAVVEICKAVDDGSAVVHLELSRSQKENEFLRRKIKLLELQVARYRAERVRGAEGSISSRFHGVRLLNRPNREALTGPTLQSRNRSVVQDQQARQKIQSINLDQDPDQEVVTTTKTETTEPDHEGELLIVKVEGALEDNTRNCVVAVDTCMSTIRDADKGSPHAAPKDPSSGGATKCCRESEDLESLTNTGSLRHKDEDVDEVPGDTPVRDCPRDPQEMEQPCCSALASQTGLRNRALRQSRANPTSPAITNSKRDTKPENPSSKLERAVEKSGSMLSSMHGGGKGEGRGQNTAMSQHQSLFCIQIKEPPRGVNSGRNSTCSRHISTFCNTPATMTTLVSFKQPIQNCWSGIGNVDNSDQAQHYKIENRNDQESGSVEIHPCLPYTCTFCSRRYAHQCQLRIHERIHTGEKPYQCAQCGKSFGQFCSLKRHKMVHTGERPFPCPHCDKHFSTSTNLKVHQSVHTGEKRFHCSKCSKNFSFLSNLIRHQGLHSTK